MCLQKGGICPSLGNMFQGSMSYELMSAPSTKYGCNGSRFKLINDNTVLNLF